MLRPSKTIRDRIPWARLLLGLAVVGPPLCIGGVLPWVLPAFALVVGAFVVRVCRPGRAAIRWPRGLSWFGVAAGLTALQWIPIGSGVLAWVAPGIAEQTALALDGTELPAWSRVSVLPGATGMELSRVLALGVLFFCAAQMSWRHTALATVVAGTAVALLGVVHRGTGAVAIYGVYAPVESSVFGPSRIGILTSFVNPNHQSALLLLGIAAAFALLIDAEHQPGHRARGAPLLPEVRLTLLAALALQTVVLLLSYSRAALVVALVLYGPVLVVLALRRARGEGDGAGRTRSIAVAAVAAVILSVVVDGAQIRAQLETLLDPEAVEPKLASIRAGLRLVELSPWLGTGRGTAVDLLPVVREDLDPVVFTYIESIPVTFIVEWGPVVGGALLLAGLGWWAMTVRAGSGPGPRTLAVGLLAVALHNGLDFGLELLGVAAPFVAVAGSIAPSAGGAHPRPRRARAVGGAVAALALLVAVSSFGDTRWSLRGQPRALAEGTLEPAQALGRRPMDPRVHTQLARIAAERGDWAQVERRAEVATRLAPATVEPWLWRGAAATAQGRPEAARAHDADALRRLAVPVEPVLVEYLARRYEPEALAALLPDDRDRVTALLDVLVEVAPDHADAAARAWVESHPDEPFALGHRIQVALGRQMPALALHHARLYHAESPGSARAALLVTRALSSFDPPRWEDMRRVLEQVLTRDDLDDPGAVEEQLILCLRQLGTPEAAARVEALMPGLLARPAPRPVRLRRRRLAAAVADR
ncbi:MAG: O-antigen ligase family protein [Myxococcota bacterium]